MIHFGNDYHHTAHPAVLEAITSATGSYPGYGQDGLCLQAADLIRAACASPAADVHFLVGGTQTNATVISSQLRPWEAVISADCGHIATHETGAIERAGHKVITFPSELGKITAEQVENCVQTYRESGITEHMPTPAMVYLSQPTEYGTVYSLAELEAMRAACDSYGLLLFIDGARLGYALTAADAPTANWTLPSLSDLAQLADIFYIGGTKCGALFGEAVVFPPRPASTPAATRAANSAPTANSTPATTRASSEHFRSSMKQNGGLLAKGWLLGAQFKALFSPMGQLAGHDQLAGTGAVCQPNTAQTLYENICAHANEQAQRIAAAFAEVGIGMLFDSPTNQQFALLTPEQEAMLSRDFVCQFFEEHQGLRAVRFCTSWSTTDDDVDALVAAIQQLG